MCRLIHGTACSITMTASPDGEEEDKTMIGLTLHPMKEIRIVVQGEHLKFVTDLLDRSGPRGTRSSITYPGRAITVSMKAICCSTIPAAR